MNEIMVTRLKGNLQTQRTVSLGDIFQEMNSEELRLLTTEARRDLADASPYGRPVILDKVPVVVFGASFTKKKGVQSFGFYTGLVLLEIQHLPDPAEREYLKRRAAIPPQTVAVFTGLSGVSLKILVRFTYLQGNVPSTNEQAVAFHALAYHKAALYYSQLLEWQVEPREPLLERGCRMSYDPLLYYNPLAIPVLMDQPVGKEDTFSYGALFRREPNPYQRMAPSLERTHLLSRLFENCWEEAVSYTGWHREQTDVAPLLTRLVENCFRSGLPEEEVVRWARMRSPVDRHEVEELRKLVVNIYQTRKGFGKKPCQGNEQLLAERMDEFMRRRYSLRYNILKDRVEYRDNVSFYFSFEPVMEKDYNTITRNMHLENIPVWDRDLKRYIHSDRVPEYNPVEEYFRSLPEWDGTDHIRKMAARVPTQNVEWEDRFYRWFLGMVAQWRQVQGIHANSTLPLLIGEQGCGKSTFCRMLLPPPLQEYYTDSIDFGNKRNAEVTLTHFLLINIDEFDSVPVAHQSYLKHILQKPVIHAKRAYQKVLLSYPRYASFIATCNHYDLLTDPSGSRRYIGVAIDGRIDYDTPVDYGQLYAQALAALQDGVRYWYTPEEEALVTSDNQPFQQLPVEEQLFLRYFRKGDTEHGEWLPAIRIVEILERKGRRKIGNRNAISFGRILKRHGIESKHTASGNVYWVAVREDEG